MSERVSIFADMTTVPVFETKPKKDKPVAEETIEQVAKQHNFPSREARKVAKAEKRKPRTYRTGRNVQFNAKLTAETNTKIYKLADEKSVTLGKILELAIDALEREGVSR